MKWRMESTSGLVPSKTLSSIQEKLLFTMFGKCGQERSFMFDRLHEKDLEIELNKATVIDYK